ncbi:F-box protein interaction domain protein [Senna tora]|uniref:F-box protein interaction domain protein n=1 Tax=Senna tora TaxID=362788 RepID=A0A834TZB7_9FABA|nr:F-box protein interaction domain protein [Senna tora]
MSHTRPGHNVFDACIPSNLHSLLHCKGFDHCDVIQGRGRAHKSSGHTSFTVSKHTANRSFTIALYSLMPTSTFSLVKGIVMKRKGDLIATDICKGKREAKEVDDPVIQPLLPSFSDLPSPITTNILLRLPIKSVLICKCVCKSWHTIISDPDFTKLHFKRAPTDVMIRTDDPKHVSRILHLLEFQPKNFRGHLGYDNWKRYCIFEDFCELNCKGHMTFEAKFKLPLRDGKMVLDKMLETNNCGRKSSSIPCKPRDCKFAVVNSCMGLLCLCNPMDRNPVVVCNPVTGEFLRLPEACKNLIGTFDCGFGYHEKTREFKVIRVYTTNAQDPTNAQNRLFHRRVAEMHTLGTGNWKSVDIGIAPSGLRFPASVNGALHWLVSFSFGMRESIVRFNFELEKFERFPSPPCLLNGHGVMEFEDISIGELNGCLYVCGIFDSCWINLWMMEEYGVEDSWTKIYTIDFGSNYFWPYGSYLPLKLFNKGAAILMYNSKYCLLFYHERRGSGYKYLTVRGTRFNFEAFAHIPSLISLKDVVKGDVEVQSVHSRCAAFKLREENDLLHFNMLSY